MFIYDIMENNHVVTRLILLVRVFIPVRFLLLKAHGGIKEDLCMQISRVLSSFCTRRWRVDNRDSVCPYVCEFCWMLGLLVY